MPELYAFLNPMPFEAADQMEKDLAEDLRAEGYTVTGGRSGVAAPLISGICARAFPNLNISSAAADEKCRLISVWLIVSLIFFCWVEVC
jgi:hypothetical protein